MKLVNLKAPHLLEPKDTNNHFLNIPQAEDYGLLYKLQISIYQITKYLRTAEFEFNFVSKNTVFKIANTTKSRMLLKVTN